MLKMDPGRPWDAHSEDLVAQKMVSELWGLKIRIMHFDAGLCRLAINCIAHPYTIHMHIYIPTPHTDSAFIS
jgi:hypothetical protein